MMKLTTKKLSRERLLRLALVASSTSALLLLAGCDAGGGFESADASASQSSDPVILDLPIAYVERPLPRDEDGNLIADEPLDPAAFRPGARLLMRDRASVSASETALTDAIFADPNLGDDALPPLYDVKDLSVSVDGQRLLFSMRAPEIEDADDDEQPTWNIWEYDREIGNIRRVISSDLVAELGQDIDPHYLADGSIVFSSTRQPRSRAILLDENKPQFDPGTEEDPELPTFVLHRMNEDGSNLQQITFNQSHDLAPTVLADGRIAFMRWDNYVGGGHDRVSLYTVNGDGSNLSTLYGYHSQDTGTNDTPAIFIDPVLLPNDELLVLLRQRESFTQGGDIVSIDTQNFVEINENVAGNDTPGPAQATLSNGIVATNDSVSPQGYYSSAAPLFDGTERLLVSFSTCLTQGVRLGVFVSTDGTLINNLGQAVDADGNLLRDGDTPVTPDPEDIITLPCGSNTQNLQNIAAAPPRYGLWTLDPTNATQRPVVLPEEGRVYTDAVVFESRPAPPFDDPVVNTEEQQMLIEQNVGVLNIRSIYDLHGSDTTSVGIDAFADPLQVSPNQRPARFIRLLKAVSLPDEDTFEFDNAAFGRAGGQMKDILGYAPIEPDGSVRVAVPADVALTFSILDAQGRRVPGFLGDRHTNWLTVRPGEVRECGGCHTGDDERVHGRLADEAPSSWPGAFGGTPFPNTVLLDEFGTPHSPPENGETMAEYFSRVNGVRTPSVNIEFVDDWSDANIVAKAEAFDLSYADLPSGAAPTDTACQASWTALCRIVVNYIEHIQPLWEVDRRIFNEFDPTLLIEDRTCVSCHNAVDTAGDAQVPAAQLELTSNISDSQNDFLTSYAELFFNDIPQEVVDGVLVDQTEQATDEDGNLLFLLDADGNQVLDGDGNPIPILVTVAPTPPYVSPAGARNSQSFFDVFAEGAIHEDYLGAAELKLLAEWLDIGGQYYNNPFLAPED